MRTQFSTQNLGKQQKSKTKIDTETLCIPLFISGVAKICLLLFFEDLHKNTTVNQRVLGSSPRGGATEKHLLAIAGAFFMVKIALKSIYLQRRAKEYLVWLNIFIIK